MQGSILYAFHMMMNSKGVAPGWPQHPFPLSILFPPGAPSEFTVVSARNGPSVSDQGVSDDDDDDDDDDGDDDDSDDESAGGHQSAAHVHVKAGRGAAKGSGSPPPPTEAASVGEGTQTKQATREPGEATPREEGAAKSKRQDLGRGGQMKPRTRRRLKEQEAAQRRAFGIRSPQEVPRR